MQNNISHHQINEETRFQVDKEKHEAQKRKFTPKTEVQRLKSVFYILTAVYLIAQTISALLASTGFIHYAQTKFNDNGVILIFFVVCFCAGLEWCFNKLNKLIAAQKYDDKTPVSRILNVLLLSFGLIYATSTFFGTPYAVEFFAAAPNYNDIEEITAMHNELIKKDTSYYNQQRKMAQSSADSYKLSHGKRDCEECPWRLRTSALKGHNVMLGKVDSVTMEANTSFSILKAEKKKHLLNAKEENEVLHADNKAWCDSFGFGLSFVSLICIIIFYFSFSWCAKYQRLELTHNDSILNQLEEAKEKEKTKERFEIEKLKALSSKVKDKDKEEEQPKVVANQASTPMGFVTATIKEGDIVKGEGRKSDRIYVMVKGDLRAMTKGEVNTLKKGQSTPERITHLQQLMNKL